MRTICPACGATSSLDALVGHAGARDAVASLIEHHPSLGRPALAYLGLFRPKTQELRLERVAKLLAPLLKDMSRGAITRTGRDWTLTTEQWRQGFNVVVQARDKGTIQCPLKDHAYLYEVLKHIADKEEGRAESQAEADRRAAAQCRVPHTESPILSAAKAVEKVPVKVGPPPEHIRKQLANIRRQ